MTNFGDSCAHQCLPQVNEDRLTATARRRLEKAATNTVRYNPLQDSSFRATAFLFPEYFDVVPAATPELLEEVFKLRYQVYCLETKFENTQDFPDQLERDDYDHRSLHSLLRHKRTGINAGTVRLVRPESGNLRSLPLHHITDHPFFVDETRFLPSTVAEISRFAISKSFRHRLDEFPSPSAAGPLNRMRERVYKRREQKVLPHITLGLFIAMVKMSYELGITTWFCVMEKALVRLLARYSLYFKPIGPTIEYHGRRQPCYADIDEFLARVKVEQPDIWELITDDGRYWPTEKTELPTSNSHHEFLRQSWRVK